MAAGDKNLVSDPFWLNLAAEEVYNSNQNRKDAVDRLQKTIVWIFGIYSSISFATILFSKKQEWNSNALVLFGISFLFLIFAYWVATIAAFPIPKSFYAGAASDVREAYNDSFKKSKTTFIVSMSLCSVGTVLYSLALFIQFTSRPYTKSELVPSSPLSLLVRKLNTSDRSATVQLFSKMNSWNSIVLIHDSIILNKSVQDTLAIKGCNYLKVSLLYVDTSGYVRAIIEPLPLNQSNLSLIVERTDTIPKTTQVIRYSLKYKF